jgi:cell division protein FtsB
MGRLPGYEIRASVEKWSFARAPWHRGLVSRPADFLQRTLPIGMLALALVAVPVLVLQPEGLPRLRSLQRELDQVDAENADLKREIGRLRVEVHQLRDDPAAVERIARDELGMVRRSEVVFQFAPSRP